MASIVFDCSNIPGCAPHIQKLPSDQCSVHLTGIQYQGPAMTLYAWAGVLQGQTYMWSANNPVPINIPAKQQMTLVNVDVTIPMLPSGQAAPGIATEAALIIATDSALANVLMDMGVTGVYDVASVPVANPQVSALNAIWS